MQGQQQPDLRRSTSPGDAMSIAQKKAAQQAALKAQIKVGTAQNAAAGGADHAGGAQPEPAAGMKRKRDDEAPAAPQRPLAIPPELRLASGAASHITVQYLGKFNQQAEAMRLSIYALMSTEQKAALHQVANQQAYLLQQERARQAAAARQTNNEQVMMLTQQEIMQRAAAAQGGGRAVTWTGGVQGAAAMQGGMGTGRAIPPLHNYAQHGGMGAQAAGGRGFAEGDEAQRSEYEIDRSRILPRLGLSKVLQRMGLSEEYQFSKEVEAHLIALAEAMLECTMEFGCLMASRRRSNMLEARDLTMYLDRNWEIRLPGYGTRGMRPMNRSLPDSADGVRGAAVREQHAKLNPSATMAQDRQPAPAGATSSSQAGAETL